MKFSTRMNQTAVAYFALQKSCEVDVEMLRFNLDQVDACLVERVQLIT